MGNKMQKIIKLINKIINFRNKKNNKIKTNKNKANKNGADRNKFGFPII